ncbi:MAG: single-stranded DNA-binding protein [Candidatus Dormibacteria bacterium]
MNAVHLVGNIAGDIEVREFPARDGGDDKFRAGFLFAVDRPVTDGGADFIRIIVWGIQARNLVKYNGNGSRIGIDGHIRGEWYEPPAVGKGPKPPRELRTHVVAERVEYLSAKRPAVAVEAA